MSYTNMPPTCAISTGKLMEAESSALDRIQGCITFSDKSLLRGSGAFQLLRRGGQIFKNSEGSAATFNLSAPVVRLKAFISHNWSTPRRDKYMCLVMHFNWWAAFAVTFLVAGALTALTGLGLLATLDFGEDGKAGFACTAACPLVFLLVLFTSSEMYAPLGLSGPPVFLDKACIHQTDKDLQREGIRRLAGFLNHSESMVIVYSPTYLSKLWTVYELASMLVLHPDGKLVVLPTVLPRILCLGVVFACGWENLYRLGKTPEAQAIMPVHVNSIAAALCLPTAVFLLVIGRRMAAEHQDILRRVAHFRVQSATCFVEADRKFVEGNIAAFMKCMGLVGREEDDEAALEMFNDLVRRRVPGALSRSLGRLGLEYQTVSAMSCATLMRAFDDLGGCLHSNQDCRLIVGLLITSFVLGLAVTPLSVAGALYVASDRPNQQMRCNAFTAMLFLKTMLLAALHFGAFLALSTALDLAMSDAVWWAPSAGIIAVLTAATVFVYAPPRRKTEQQAGLGGLLASKGSRHPPSLFGGGAEPGRDAAGLSL